MVTLKVRIYLFVASRAEWLTFRVVKSKINLELSGILGVSGLILSRYLVDDLVRSSLMGGESLD